jgi:hypothetical protein
MMWLVKGAVKSIVPGSVLGAIDYVRFPSLAVAGGPFNGQPARQVLFHALTARLRPDAIVETGTHRGTTTDFMAQTGLPVFTIELDARLYGFASARLQRRRNITLLRGDSRATLRNLFTERLRILATRTLFFYLDAHWNADLPLAEEIDIIFYRCASAVVMIDDFQVPFDLGYMYDDYGAGRSLAFPYIAPVASAHRLRAFYPSTPSAEEGGSRRGCIVLTKQASHAQILAAMPLLRCAENELIDSALGGIEPVSNAVSEAR